MNCDTPVDKTHPMFIAWETYKASDGYANIRRWALVEAHVDGSLWTAFVEGWETQERSLANLRKELDEARVLRQKDNDGFNEILARADTYHHAIEQILGTKCLPAQVPRFLSDMLASKDARNLADKEFALKQMGELLAQVSAGSEDLKAAREAYRTSSVCEIAAENPNVASYMEHWEGRAIRAENRVTELAEQLKQHEGLTSVDNTTDAALKKPI